MNLILGGYRSWALEAFKRSPVPNFRLVHNNDELSAAIKHHDHDVVVLAGWSWIVPTELCEDNVILGLHPSDLPAYAGGSPIQHQIIDGVVDSKMSLFRLTGKLDAGDIYHKVSLSLRGNMVDVLRSLENATVTILRDIVKLWPDGFSPSPQPVGTRPLRRLRPEHSELTRDVFGSLTARQLYDFIRCREDPYPNVFIKDHTGCLKIKLVDFEASEEGDA